MPSSAHYWPVAPRATSLYPSRTCADVQAGHEKLLLSATARKLVQQQQALPIGQFESHPFHGAAVSAALLLRVFLRGGNIDFTATVAATAAAAAAAARAV